jgi:hypothetical protein
MKNLILALLTLFTLNFATAQSCANGWLPFEKGITYEHTHYNKKGKIESVSNGTVVEVTANDEGDRAEVKINTTDKKGKSTIPEMVVYYNCKGDVYEMDMSDFFNSMTGALPEEVEMDVKSIKLIFPKNMKVGDELPDSNAEFSATMMGMKIMSGKVSQTDRKVVGEEEITVSAGTFDCLKITETISSDFSMAQITFETTTWISKGVGIVKQEMERGGNMDSNMELTKFTK